MFFHNYRFDHHSCKRKGTHKQRRANRCRKSSLLRTFFGSTDSELRCIIGVTIIAKRVERHLIFVDKRLKSVHKISGLSGRCLTPVSIAWSDYEFPRFSPGWDASPLQVTPPWALLWGCPDSWPVPIYTWVERGNCEDYMYCPITQHSDPSQRSNPDTLIIRHCAIHYFRGTSGQYFLHETSRTGDLQLLSVAAEKPPKNIGTERPETTSGLSVPIWLG